MVHLTVMPVTVELTKRKMQTKYYNTISFVLNSVFRTKTRPFLNTDIKNLTFFARQYNVHKIVAKRYILRSHATGTWVFVIFIMAAFVYMTRASFNTGISNFIILDRVVQSWVTITQG